MEKRFFFFYFCSGKPLNPKEMEKKTGGPPFSTPSKNPATSVQIPVRNPGKMLSEQLSGGVFPSCRPMTVFGWGVVLNAMRNPSAPGVIPNAVRNLSAPGVIPTLPISGEEESLVSKDSSFRFTAFGMTPSAKDDHCFCCCGKIIIDVRQICCEN